MKKFLFLIFWCATATMAIAQTDAPAKGNGKISGVVKDSTHQMAGVEFANITLLNAAGKAVDGTMADIQGNFSMTKIAPGTYSVTVSFLGYDDKTIRNIKISDARAEINLGSVSIGQTAKVLKEVIVEGQKTLIEEKVDRTVYNAENDQTAKGGDATDVLKRVPMLSVDMDGNVSLRGSQNIKVLINNKPSTISASSVADALKQIPADQIKTVEVITSPSAKYDAEGSAGIINIILKKNNLQGASLNIDASSGYRGTNFGLNGSYRKKNMGFSLGGFGRANYNTPGEFYNVQTTRAPFKTNPDLLYNTTNTQSASTRNNGLFGNYTLGWDYDIDKNNSLTASVKYGVRNQHTYQDNLTTVTNVDTTGATPMNSVKDVNTKNNSGTIDASLNYTHTFSKPNQEFSLLTLFSRNNGTSNFLNTILYGDSTNLLRNNNKSTNQESTIQADYQTPLSTNQMLEFGGKAIMRKVNSAYQYYSAGSGGVYVPIANSALSNALAYSQNITAGYVSYTLTGTKGYSLKAGTRYEYTTIKAHQASDGKDLGIPSYGVVVPSLNLSRKFANGNVLKAAYNRRIQRPSIQFLNPNLQASNPLNTTTGNPQLSPEYTNNFELAYSTYVGGSSFNFSTFARNTNNSIQAVRDVTTQTINGATVQAVHTTYANIGKQDAYGFSIFTNIAISNKFNLNAGTDMYYAILDNPSDNIAYRAHNEGWVINGRLFGNYTIGKGYGLQFFGFVRGKQVQLQGTQGAFHLYSISMKKDLMNKKGSIGLGVENVFTPTIKIKNVTQSYYIDQQSYNTMHYLNFKVTFSYRIGKMSFDAPKKRRKSVTNDDLLEGGGDNGAGAQQGGGAQGGGAPAGAAGGANGAARTGGAPGGAYPPGAGQKGKTWPGQGGQIKKDSLHQRPSQKDSLTQDSLNQKFSKPDSLKKDSLKTEIMQKPVKQDLSKSDTTKLRNPADKPKKQP